MRIKKFNYKKGDLATLDDLDSLIQALEPETDGEVARFSKDVEVIVKVK